MRRLGVRPGDEPVITVLAATFVALRLLAVRWTPLLYVDTADYRTLALFGGARRPFTVPLLYKLVPSDGWRIVEQVVISGLAWLALAFVVHGMLEHRWARVGGFAAILACGLTTQITNWDSAILADSITISLTVLLVAAWLLFHRRPSTWTAVAVIAVTLLWTFTRDMHVYVTAALALVAVIVFAPRWRERTIQVLAVGLVVVSVAGWAADQRNQDTTVENLAGVVGGRIFPDASARAWFVGQGMPAEPQLSGAQPREALQAIPEFERWLRTEGVRTYALYLATHPKELVTGPYGDLLDERSTYAEQPSTKAVMLSPAEAYGRSRAVLPPALESLLFDAGHTGSILFLSVLALAATAVLHRMRRDDDRRRIPLVVIAAVFPYMVVSWHGSVFEPGRHAMPAATALRLGVLVLLAVVADQLLTERAAAPNETT